MSRNLKRKRLAAAILSGDLHIILCDETHLFVEKGSKDVIKINSSKKERDKILEESDVFFTISVNSEKEEQVEILKKFQETVSKVIEELNKSVDEFYEKEGRFPEQEEINSIISSKLNKDFVEKSFSIVNGN